MRRTLELSGAGAIHRHRPHLLSAVPHAALSVVVGYLFVLTAAATAGVMRKRPRTPVDEAPQHRFAVLVPAHDEEASIGATLRSLRALDYPEELVDVHVVADNCTDGTADVVRAHGFEVHERAAADDPGKGPALRWLIDRLAARGAGDDAFVFVDADTDVDRCFLREADAALTDGATVVQSYYGVRDPGASPAIAFRAAALAARHYLRPLGRIQLGSSAGLYGNGMVFRTSVFDTYGWTGHLTEDLELQIALLLGGTKVAFARNARVAAEMPATAEAAHTQQQRWERGRVEVARRFLPALVRRTVRGGPAGRAAYADAALDLLVPPLSVVGAASALLTLTDFAVAVVHPSRGARRRLGLAVALVGAQALHVLTALVMVGAPPTVYRGLLRAPQLAAWKVGVWLGVMRRDRHVTWIRTARNDEPAR